MASPTRKDAQVVSVDNPVTRCPACGHQGGPHVVSVASTSSGLNIFVFCLFMAVCACCLLGGGMDSSLAFFCQRCGLRLVSERNIHSRVTYDPSDLTPNEGTSDKRGAVPGAHVVKSPVGLPVAVDKDWIINAGRRFTNMRPLKKLDIEKGRYKIPCSFTSLTPEFPASYTIEMPGMAPEQPADKKELQYLQSDKCSWNRHQPGPHFQVFMQCKGIKSLEVAQVHLRGGTLWGVDIKMPGGEGAGRKTWNTYQMQAADEIAWSISGAGVVWHSSQGVLLWNLRKIDSDGDGAKGRILCLLDAYDRLVAVIWKTKRPDGNGKMWELRIYIDISGEFLDEIIASYVAVRVQAERIVQEHIHDSS
ncbi:unnamed protein product [Clonostachys rosea]|uniref:LITAF domain-containing protein n=1 Tax=Bionectria ochroleuca TaxID=29856 RepID=A0ABY6U9Z8_BIOOC|nr:unnamed protein product [Clonostachys rosea]